MILSKAYGAGKRAGRAQPRFKRLYRDSEQKVIATPRCPYQRPWQFLCAFLWHEGHYVGTMQRLNVKG